MSIIPFYFNIYIPLFFMNTYIIHFEMTPNKIFKNSHVQYTQILIP